jgi:hypothetical protein
MLHFYYSAFVFQTFKVPFLIKFVYPEIATALKIHVPFCIVTDYDVWFIVRDGSVGSRFLVP